SPSGITRRKVTLIGNLFFMPYTYILYSNKLNKYYIGACTDLNRRLSEHNTGKSTFTAKGRPWLIVYVETFDSLQEAKARETYIKKQKSRIFIEKLIRR
ncbi:MAG: GIY-YIG nuclease family protein, partial [Sediminibacterium sp.]